MENDDISEATVKDRPNKVFPEDDSDEKSHSDFKLDSALNESVNEMIRSESINCRCKVTSRSVKPLFLLLRTNFSVLMIICASGVFNCRFACAKEQKFAMEPQDQSAVVGSRVTLPCRVVNKSGQLQWTKDDFGLGTHRHLVGYERYKMIGSDEEGDYSLDIRDVTLEDDAQYQCQVSSGPQGEPGIRSRYARLSVMVPPDPPRIVQGPSIEAIEDRDISLECVSAGGKPAAEITWVDSDGGVLTQGVTYAVEPTSDGRKFTARSVLSLRPRRHHDNQTFTCQAQNTADRAYKAATVKLEVKYAPKVKIRVLTAPKNKAQEGDTLKVGCLASANPSDLRYKWYINNEQVTGNFTSELVIRNVSRKLNEATVKCEVYNTIGKSVDSKTLEVAYGPTFIVKPEDVEAEEGSSVTLKCIVDAHPAPEVLWLRYEKGRMVRVGKSPTLTVAVTRKTASQYWCRASVEGYPEIEAHANVYLKGPPKIQSNRTQYGVEGDSTKIDCIAFSVPKPDYITWSFGGMDINPFHNPEYAFLEESLQDGLTKSTLIVRESESRHFGLYNCTVTNLYGTDTIQIHLIPDKSFPMIVIVSGGASSAILVLIILLLIMLCHRKRRKSLPSEFIKKPDITDVKGKEDMFNKDNDRHSNISDLKLELRQVEGSCDLDPSNAGSESDFQTTQMMNTGLSLAGPVSLNSGYDPELMKTYHRFSADFSDSSNVQLKLPSQGNGYIPYVDYSRDYIPPAVHAADSLSLSQHGQRSIDTCSTLQYGEVRTGSLQRLAGCGPDVIPMTNAALCMGSGIDVRYAATYGNPYLRIGQMPYIPHVNTANPGATPAPPPYYTVRSPVLPAPVTTVTSPSTVSSRSSTSHQPASTSSSSAQPQVPKLSPQSPAAMYLLPTSSSGGQVTQITTKGKASTGTHV